MAHMWKSAWRLAVLRLLRRNPRARALEELKPLFEKRFNKWAKKRNIIFLETSYDKISLKELEENSIWRVPPFEDVRRSLDQCKKCRAEKGFRDALILFSVLELANKIPKNKVYFICNDKLFLEATNSYNKNKRLVIFRTIEELSSHLRLSLQKDNEIWITRISEKAREVFLRRVWKECNIREEIEKKFPEKFELALTSQAEFEYSTGLRSRWNQEAQIMPGGLTDIYKPISLESPFIRDAALRPSETKYVPLGEGKYFVDNPSFQRVEDNNIYIWESTVSYEREYQEQLLIGIMTPKIHRIYFDVIWSAKVTKNEQFSNLKLSDLSVATI